MLCSEQSCDMICRTMNLKKEIKIMGIGEMMGVKIAKLQLKGDYPGDQRSFLKRSRMCSSRPESLS